MIDYAEVTRLCRKHKAALTRAKNSGKQTRIIDACDAALADFERVGYPDNWHLWRQAREDAAWDVQRRVTSDY
jgi:hypothetical protein